MMSKAHIVVCPTTGARLCQDDKYRTHANFGTYPSCVKIYKKLKWAEKAADKYKTLEQRKYEKQQEAEGSLVKIRQIVHLHDGDSMDAAGNIFRKDS